jgi:hypothetical protein
VKGDGAALDRLLADDYLLVNSQGKSETKADFICDYTAKGSSFAPFMIQKPVEKVWATGVVLGGVVDAHGTSDGKPMRAASASPTSGRNATAHGG